MAVATRSGRVSGRVHLAVVGVAALIGGALLWRPGFVLTNDSVAVPAQDLLPWMWGAGSGPPRSVPQDAIVAVLDEFLPGAVLQRVMILGPLIVLGLGVAGLLRERSAFEQCCAATFGMWSTYLYERLAMGHWGVVLGLACLAWIISAAADARRGVARAPARVIAWAAVGSLVPSGGALMVAAVLVVLAWPGPRAARQSLIALAGVLTLQLVWVVPGLLHPGAATPEAADLFGVRGEGGAGALLTALGTGGIWNSAVMPPSRNGALAVVVPLAVLALAAAGASRVRTLAPDIVGPLSVLALAGLAWAAMTAIPALSEAVLAIESLPGGGLLRDSHKWLAPWAILLSLAAGAGLARVATSIRPNEARVPAMVLALAVPAILLPDLALGMWGRLQPTRYPDDWNQVRSHLSASPEPGDVVSWPWSTFRAYDWNEGQTVLDPAPRYLPRTVVTDSRLLVQSGGELTVVDSDDPRSQSVGEALLQPYPAPRLQELGIAWILVQAGQPPTPGFPADLPASLLRTSAVVVATPTLELRAIQGAPAPQDSAAPWPMWIAWALWVVTVCAAAAVGLRYWMLGRPGGVREARAEGASLRHNERS